ncbi:c-type cytochrome [Spiribacter halobius]|uniref:Cytochrome c5 family protein n=1 Tax=Sediminicurvatus halobius TaxID=2182432 RepID=A0A2U2N9G2_9GAMM|nr:c-type cytochrome [Spiribacter halobius]PWG65723.1 cytochrome c5 family protein [Spiribacter halobius]UEX77757.1 c-type cytochrome [Spiribacter halobius]
MSHEQDSIFIRNFIGVIGMLVGVTILLIIIATVLYEADTEGQRELAIERAERNLAPVGEVRLTGEPMPATMQQASAEEASDEPRSGEEVTQAVCIACHQGNFQNAPAVGDQDAWGERIGKGWETLVSNVYDGYGNMPAQGGSATEEEIRAAIEYMVEDETGLEIPES